MTGTARLITSQPGDRESFTIMGDRYTAIAVGEDTGGAYALLEVLVPSGSMGPPPHLHGAEEEGFYVLEGELAVLLGDRSLNGRQGSFTLVPRGTVHGFSNQGTADARLLVIISPAGFEHALEEIARLAPTADTAPDMDQFLAIARKYQLEMAGPPPEH